MSVFITFMDTGFEESVKIVSASLYKYLPKLLG